MKLHCYLQVDWQGKNDITLKLILRSLDGIYQIAELSDNAAEVLRTLSRRHRIYTVYFAILLLLIADEIEWLKM